MSDDTLAQLRERLASLNPLQLELVDESHLHAGHAGARDGGGHYRITLVAEIFRGRNTLSRHRLVYDAVGNLMQGPVHALAIRALTPEEA
ncbi:MAG: BolA family protein [Azovibrio sp.]|uniref:BolA family protein n=1 Tax=Azovibrio sp. TaxID=1872673 RepID=UPI003C71C43C